MEEIDPQREHKVNGFGDFVILIIDIVVPIMHSFVKLLMLNF